MENGRHVKWTSGNHVSGSRFGEDLGSVSDIVTDAMTAFGMKTSESSHFADVLAQASANANTNVGMMGNTFQYVAPVAEHLAIQWKMWSGVGLMANAGIKAEKAGTAMRAMLTNLAKPTKQVQGYMDKLSLVSCGQQRQHEAIPSVTAGTQTEIRWTDRVTEGRVCSWYCRERRYVRLLAILSASDADFNKLAESIDNSAEQRRKCQRSAWTT